MGIAGGLAGRSLMRGLIVGLAGFLVGGAVGAPYIPGPASLFLPWGCPGSERPGDAHLDSLRYLDGCGCRGRLDVRRGNEMLERRLQCNSRHMFCRVHRDIAVPWSERGDLFRFRIDGSCCGLTSREVHGRFSGHDLDRMRSSERGPWSRFKARSLRWELSNASGISRDSCLITLAWLRSARAIVCLPERGSEATAGMPRDKHFRPRSSRDWR